MKFLLTLMLLLASLHGSVQAAEQAMRPTVVFFYIDELNAGEPEKGEIKRDTVERFQKIYSSSYTLRPSDYYSNAFTVNRFTDLQNFDRFDLLPRLVKDKVDYAVFYIVLPLKTKTDLLLPATTSQIYVRVFDINKNKYINDSNLTYTATWAWPSDHFAKLFADADRQVFQIAFPLKMRM